MYFLHFTIEYVTEFFSAHFQILNNVWLCFAVWNNPAKINLLLFHAKFCLVKNTSKASLSMIFKSLNCQHYVIIFMLIAVVFFIIPFDIYVTLMHKPTINFFVSWVLKNKVY